jgi:hypothetical protein
MATIATPKLLDVVEFDDITSGQSVRRRGTVVELLGEPPQAVLLEISGTDGAAEDFYTVSIKNVKVIWSAKAPAPSHQRTA